MVNNTGAGGMQEKHCRDLLRILSPYTDILKLEAYHRAENAKSGRVLEKSAMHITDTVQRFVREGISAENEVCYCIEKNEYLRNCLRNLTL